jgi:DNA-binding XRE family transcriptional regulator
MKRKTESGYRRCRKAAAFTQERAAEALGVSVRSLQCYETGETKTPDDIAVSMADLYHAPMLVWYHFQHTTVLSTVLPEITPTDSLSGMAFQLVAAEYMLGKATRRLTAILADGEVSAEETPDFERAMDAVTAANSKLLSASLYAGCMKGISCAKAAR